MSEKIAGLLYNVGYADDQLNDNPAVGDGTGAQQFNYDGRDYDLRNDANDNGARGLIQARSVALNPLTNTA